MLDALIQGLSLVAEPGQTVRFRIRFGCDIDGSNNMGAGFFVDDVEFLVIE